MRKPWLIQYKNKFVGGYSLKLNKVWYVPQKEQAQKFTDIQVSEFIASHAGKGRDFELEFATLIRLKHGEKIDRKDNKR